MPTNDTVGELLKRMNYKGKYVRVLPHLAEAIAGCVANAISYKKDDGLVLIEGSLKEIKKFSEKIDVDFLSLLKKFYENKEMGEKITSSNESEDKRKAMDCYTKCIDIAKKLSHSKNLPRWLTLQILSHAISLKGSLYFYDNQFNNAQSCFKWAKDKQLEIESEGFLEEGSFNDKLAEIVIFQMPNYAAYAHNIGDMDGLIQFLDDDVDSVFFDKYKSMINGKYIHSDKYAAGLIEFLERRISEGEIIYTRNEYEDPEIIGRSLNRKELLSHSATFYANRGYCSMLIGSNLNSEEHFIAARNAFWQSLIVHSNCEADSPVLKCSEVHLRRYLSCSKEFNPRLQKKKWGECWNI